MSWEVKIDTAKIQRLRRKRGWSTDDLARQAGITRRAVQYIESGQRMPYPGTMIALATALDLEPDDLLKRVRRRSPERVA